MDDGNNHKNRRDFESFLMNFPEDILPLVFIGIQQNNDRN